MCLEGGFEPQRANLCFHRTVNMRSCTPNLGQVKTFAHGRGTGGRTLRAKRGSKGENVRLRFEETPHILRSSRGCQSGPPPQIASATCGGLSDCLSPVSFRHHDPGLKGCLWHAPAMALPRQLPHPQRPYHPRHSQSQVRRAQSCSRNPGPLALRMHTRHPNCKLGTTTLAALT